MILLMAFLGFCGLLFLVCKYLLKDFTRFLWKKNTFYSPKTFVDFGEYTVSVAFALVMSVFGVLFYKFGTSFFAYLISDDLVSFFVILRGVFSIESEIQNPFSLQHSLFLFITPALHFSIFYLIYRSIRTFMFYINQFNRNTYSESDVIYFGFISALGFLFVEIILFSQYHKPISSITHILYLALSKISVIVYYLTVAHIQLLKNEQYRINLPTYVRLGRFEERIIFNPKKIIFISYLLGLALFFPFHSGTQFLNNNVILIFIFFVFFFVFAWILKVFFSDAFNYLGVVMMAESPANLKPNEKVFEAKIEKRILFGIATLAFVLALFKLKLFFAVIVFISFLAFIFLIGLIFFYCLGLGFSFLIAWNLGHKTPKDIYEVIRDYMITVFKATSQAIAPMVGFIFFVLFLFSFFPKHFDFSNKDHVTSVFDTEGKPLYIEHSDGNGCIPVSRAQVPDFFFKCLYAQEDRTFTKQNNFFPADFPRTSNWHGVSLAVFYRFFVGGGGSNLNMQLIKNVANVTSQDIQRKIAESITAYQLSIQTRDTIILAAYLNEVSMTGGINQSGVMKGSLYTFGLPISRLNPLEIMYLVSTLKRSSSFKTKNGDVVNYKDAVAYKEVITETLLDRAKIWMEKGLISKREYNSLRNQDLRFVNKPYKPISKATTNQFFLKQIRLSKVEGSTFISTISEFNQRKILKAVRKFETKFQSFKKFNNSELYAAAIVVEVESGNIIGHYGSEGVTDLIQFAGGYPVGSVIKPFILLEMLESGFGFDDIRLYDGKIKGKLTPKNFSESYSNKFVGVKEILGKSLNAPMVNIREVANSLDLFQKVEERFSEMKISKDKYLQLDNPKRKKEIEINYPLGSRNMNLFEIAQAYQTLFNKGICLKLNAFSSVYDPIKGRIHRFNMKETNVYEKENAEMIAHALSSTMNEGGTGTHIKYLLPKDKTYFVKTGTSDKARHGYTILCDGDILIVCYISYGKIENEYLSLGLNPIPFESGGRSAGVLAAFIYDEIQSVEELRIESFF